MRTRAKSKTRVYDLFKGLVAVCLLIIIAVLLLHGRAAPVGEAPSEAELPAAELAVPSINPPMLGEGGSISLSGTGQPGATVELWAGDAKLGDVVVGDDGAWSWDGSLEPGDYEISARTVDAAGQTLNEGPALAVSVPEPVVEIVLPAINPPTLGNGGSISLSGTGQPGATVELWAGGVKLGDVLVGDDGTWSWDGSLEPGDYEISARTVDASGQTLNENPALAVSVPEPVVEIALPVINMPTPGEGEEGSISLSGSGEPGATVELWAGDAKLGDVVVGDDGAWSWDGSLEPGDYEISARTVDASGQTLNEALAAAFTVAAEAAPPTPTLTQPQVDAQGTITLTGTAEAGTIIEIVEDGAVVGTALVADDGTWSFSYQAAAGAHQLAARSHLDPDVMSAEVGVEVEPSTSETAPSVATEAGEDQAYIVQPGDNLSALAERFYGDGQLWRLIFEGTNEQAAEDATFNTIENPDLIMPGWKLWIPTRED
jgi:nucleoid-associated protein YgaU